MNFILQEQKIDLGDTSVENIFIDDYMPQADGVYVKVYLLGYKYASDTYGRERFGNETIAKNLNITVEDVWDAWDYWELEGIIIKHQEGEDDNYTVEFVNLKQLYIDNIYQHVSGRGYVSAQIDENEQLISVSRNNNIKPMFDEIEKILGRPLVISERKKIIGWLNEYNTIPDMMVQAFSYCVNNKKKKSFRSIESVVISWHDAGVCDIETMAEYLEKKNDRYYVYSRISRALGFMNRILTEAEMKTIDKWVDQWKFSMDMILKCLENSIKMTSPNLNYFDTILEKWYNKGYKNPEDLKNDKKPEDKPKIQTSQPKNKFHNFDQRLKDYSEGELEQISRRNFEKKLKQLGIAIPSDTGDDN